MRLKKNHDVNLQLLSALFNFTLQLIALQNSSDQPMNMRQHLAATIDSMVGRGQTKAENEHWIFVFQNTNVTQNDLKYWKRQMIVDCICTWLAYGNNVITTTSRFGLAGEAAV